MQSLSMGGRLYHTTEAEKKQKLSYENRLIAWLVGSRVGCWSCAVEAHTCDAWKVCWSCWFQGKQTKQRQLCINIVAVSLAVFDAEQAFAWGHSVECSYVCVFWFSGTCCGAHPRVSQGWSWHSKGFLEITVKAVDRWMSNETSWMHMWWHLCKWLSCSSIVSTSTTF